MIAAVLFDMDGVLVDARDWHFEALNKALALFGMAIPRERHLETFDGLPTRRKLELLSATRGLPRELHGLVNALKQRHTVDAIHAGARPQFRHQFALARLKAEGLKLAVCSNATRASVTLMMEKTGLARFLDLMLSNEDVAKPKPDPEIYLAAMARLGMAAAQCLILEDNPYGLEAARASGAHVLEIGTPEDVSYARIRAAIAASGGAGGAAAGAAS